jgi:hypothetical protein
VKIEIQADCLRSGDQRVARLGAVDYFMTNGWQYPWASVLISALLVAAGARCASATEQRGADEVGVFQCRFGEDWDVNFDHWPDRWIRRSGPDYPHYVEIELADDPDQGRCLKIDLDGAAASVSSPPIRVMSRFSYKLEAKLKNERLERSTVVLKLEFFDAHGRLLQTETSKPIASTSGWHDVSIDSIEPKDPNTERAVIGIDVISGMKGDLRGRVSIADVWLARLPRISVATNNAFNVYTKPQDVTVKCDLSGILEQNPEIDFRLLDSAGKQLDASRKSLRGQLIHEKTASATPAENSSGPAGYEGTSEWQPKIPSAGYYRVVVRILSGETKGEVQDHARELHPERTIYFTVLPALDMPIRGEFGWSLPEGDRPLSLDNLSRLLPQAGINWVKFPAWYDARDSRRGDDLVRFVELAAASNIEVVGVIDRPPNMDASKTIVSPAPVVDYLSLEPSNAWLPTLEPVMTRLSLRVRWWQLGRDFDTSLASDPNVNQRIRELRTKLFRFGQDVRLGLNWDWESEQQVAKEPAWEFQQYCFSSPAGNQKLDTMLQRQHTSGARRWVLVEPPTLQEGPAPLDHLTPDIMRKFVMQLVSAKEHGAAAIFVPNPFNDKNGLMRSDGMPAEWLLPWRTTAAMLGGGEFLGQMQLPGGSENRVFLRPDGRIVMVVWNERPTQEVMYFGKEVEQFDVLGHRTSPQMEKDEQVIEVGPLPTFVLGLHEAITRWRMAIAFEKEQVPSVYSKAHANTLSIRNFFPQGVGGTLSIVVPRDDYGDRLERKDATPATTETLSDRWSIEPPERTFKLARDEVRNFPFEVRLKNGATYGKQPIRIDFRVEADESYSFSVYRTMEVGTGDVTLHVNSHINDDGVLIVEQFMTNLSPSPADFKCSLRANGRRPQRSQVYQLAGKVPDRKVYRFPNGTELLGQQMELDIEELNGADRIFRYRFEVINSPPETEATLPARKAQHRAGEQELVVAD